MKPYPPHHPHAKKTSPRARSAIPLAAAVACSLVLLSNHVSAAITIVGPLRHIHSENLTQLPADAFGSVTLNPDPVSYLAPPAMGSNFMNTFLADEPQYPGWTAKTGDPLNGTLTINLYEAHDYGSRNFPPQDVPRGGADIIARYTGPLPPIALEPPLRWIQMYTEDDHQEMSLVSLIDPFPNTDDLPFYYTIAQGIDNMRFSDAPSVPIKSIPFIYNITFQAYLASFDDITKVATIHDGFSWGYTILAQQRGGQLVPEFGSSLTLLILAIGALLTFRHRAA